MATGQTPATLEQYLGIDGEQQFPQDWPMPEGTVMEGGPSAMEFQPGVAPPRDANGEPLNHTMRGIPGEGGEPPTEEPPADIPPPTQEPPADGTGPKRTPTHGGITDPGTGQPTVGQPTAPSPDDATPPSTDYSKLNDMIAQMLKERAAKTAGDADFRKNLRDTIMGLIKSGSAPVDANDPTMASARNAFRGEGERALALLREKQTEASRAGGRTAGSEESAMKGGYEDLGNATGAYSANLQIQELQSRRQQLMQATQLGAGVMGADEANALQTQIAAIDGQLKQLGLQSSESLGRIGLKNQNRQFYDNLSYLMGNQANSLDDLLSQYLLNAA